MRSSGIHFRTILDTVETLSSEESFSGICDAIINSISIFGYNHICFLVSAKTNTQSFDDRVLMKRWPRAWAEHYAASNFYSHDPIAPRIRMQPQPFMWADLEIDSSHKQAKAIMQIAKFDYGLSNGLCVPIHGENGYQAGISIAGKDIDTSHEAKATIEVITFYAYNRLMRFKAAPIKRFALTKREREVLTWAAVGKTSWDTAAILNISTNTVNKIMASAMQRLGVHTRAQAVAESLRRGEISL